MTKVVSHFHNFAVIALAMKLTEHEGDRVPASCVGGILKHISGWESSDLLFLMDMIREPLEFSIITDVETLLEYVPSRPFRNRDEVFEWYTNHSTIAQAVDLAKKWGFCAERKKPSNDVQCNAFLIKGLEILSRSKDELIDRESVFQLMRCLGLSMSEALQTVEAQKQR